MTCESQENQSHLTKSSTDLNLKSTMFSGVFWGAIKNGVVEIVKGYHMSSSSESSSSSSSSTSSTSSSSTSSSSSSTMWKHTSSSSSSQSFTLRAISTGNSGNGFLNNGDVDPHWKLVEDPTHALGSISAPVYCVNSAQNGYWGGEAGSTMAKWIHSVNGLGNQTFPAGYYTYETYFPSNQHFTIRGRADDFAYVYFNGRLVLTLTSTGFPAWGQAAVTSGFVSSGNNVLRVRSYNYSSYTGIQVECIY